MGSSINCRSRPQRTCAKYAPSVAQAKPKTAHQDRLPVTAFVHLTAVGRRLSDEASRVAIAFRLGTGQPHTCFCGAMVAARELHRLACGKNAPRHIHYSQLNDLIWRAVKKAQIPTSKESLAYPELKAKDRAERHWPSGPTANLWRGMLQSLISSPPLMSRRLQHERGSVNKTGKYNDMANTHIYVDVLISTLTRLGAEDEPDLSMCGDGIRAVAPSVSSIACIPQNVCASSWSLVSSVNSSGLFTFGRFCSEHH